MTNVFLLALIYTWDVFSTSYSLTITGYTPVFHKSIRTLFVMKTVGHKLVLECVNKNPIWSDPQKNP